MPVQGRNQALAREKAPPPADSRGFGTRGTTERPNVSSLSRDFNVSRKTIIRDLQDLIRRGQLPEEIYPEWKQDVSED